MKILILLLIFQFIKTEFLYDLLRKGFAGVIKGSGVQDSTAKSNMGISSCHSLNKDYNPSQGNDDNILKELLTAKITGMTLGISPLGQNMALDDTFKSELINVFGLRGILPRGFWGSTLYHHTSALLNSDKGYIYLEYKNTMDFPITIIMIKMVGLDLLKWVIMNLLNKLQKMENIVKKVE